MFESNGDEDGHGKREPLGFKVGIRAALFDQPCALPCSQEEQTLHRMHKNLLLCDSRSVLLMPSVTLTSQGLLSNMHSNRHNHAKAEQKQGIAVAYLRCTELALLRTYMVRGLAHARIRNFTSTKLLLYVETCFDHRMAKLVGKVSRSVRLQGKGGIEFTWGHRPTSTLRKKHIDTLVVVYSLQLFEAAVVRSRAKFAFFGPQGASSDE
jgi:hypothetical protein